VFRLLGFDVRIRPGFVVFMVLIVLIYSGDEFGVWLAGSLAVFTLVHELGHAVVARRNGADAEISLDFLAGYTSYRPRTTLSRAQRALISAAGPLTHIVVSVAVLAAMGVNPLDRPSVDEPAASAVWWAGPAIGLLNLVPVLPLDGGNIAQTGLETVLGDRARRTMAMASIAITAAFAVWCALDESRRGWFVFVAFLLIAQIQILSAMSTHAPQRRQAVTDAVAGAERAAWTTGRPGMLVPGQQLSPWYRAHRALLAGQPDEARRIVLDDLTSSAPAPWWPPYDAHPEQLRAVVSLIPRPFPPGNPRSEFVLADVALRSGDPLAAGHYAAESFGRARSAGTALVVARAAATVGDRDTALRWLHAAAATPGAVAVAEAIDHAPELAGLRDDPAVRDLRASLSAP
jgi:Zn-dependent protease